MTDGLARARADLAAGRPWKARDRLNGLLVHRHDDEVLDALATVHHQMRDLPAAGAIWFATGRDDDVARTAIAEWRARYGSDQARWLSIPSPLRAELSAPHLVALEQAARAAQAQGTGGQGRSASGDWWDVVLPVGCLVLVLLVAATTVIGAWTVIHWMWT